MKLVPEKVSDAVLLDPFETVMPSRAPTDCVAAAEREELEVASAASAECIEIDGRVEAGIVAVGSDGEVSVVVATAHTPL